jgi:hypothetical protein
VYVNLWLQLYTDVNYQKTHTHTYNASTETQTHTYTHTLTSESELSSSDKVGAFSLFLWHKAWAPPPGVPGLPLDRLLRVMVLVVFLRPSGLDTSGQRGCHKKTDQTEDSSNTLTILNAADRNVMNRAGNRITSSTWQTNISILCDTFLF